MADVTAVLVACIFSCFGTDVVGVHCTHNANKANIDVKNIS